MQFLNLHKLFGQPYGIMMFGLLLFLLGAIALTTGTALTRGAVVYREREPKSFWWIVALDFACGLIAYFMYLGTTDGYPPLW